MEETFDFTPSKVGEEGFADDLDCQQNKCVAAYVKGTQRNMHHASTLILPEPPATRRTNSFQAHHVHDNDEHVWLYAFGLVGEYTQTHTLIHAGLFQTDKDVDTSNDLEYLFQELEINTD